MCGIIAVWNIKTSIIDSSLKKLSLRGRDGYGFFVTDLNSSKTERTLANVETYSTLSNIKPVICLANSRATPTTEYETGAGFDIKNQQPFENKRFVVVHNGIIANDKELIKKFKLKPIANVDSAILPELFLELGVVKGLKELKGSYAILCWDKQEKKLYAAKNFMPLRVFLEPDKALFISLQEMAPLQPTEEVRPYSCIEIDIVTGDVEQYSLYPRERNKKVLVICSSGADSATTAYLYKHLGYEVGLVHFKYKQAAEGVELHCIKRLAKKLGAKLYVYNARSIFGIFKQNSLLLTQKKADETKQMLDAESTLSYVPARNIIMATISAGVAEMYGYDTVAMGLQQMDSVYIDNNPGMVENMDSLLKYGLNWETNIHFASPCIHLIKHEIFSLGERLGIDFNNDSVSCYYPKIRDGKVIPCHSCGCCQFKDTALRMIKERDFIGDIDIFINKYVLPFI